MASYAMLTNVGRNKEAAALADGTPLSITAIAWGDGTRIPAGGETALESEQGRKPVAARGVTAGALNTAFFEVLLAEDEGPFVIREAGLFDTEGDMIAVAHYNPPVNKPLTTVSAHLRINVVFSDLENLIIQIDASTAFVSADTYTPEDILAKLLTVHGHGSGLDADKLDGLNASAFVRTSRKVIAGDGLSGGGGLHADRTLSVDIASAAEAEAGTSNAKVMTPSRTLNQAVVRKNAEIGSMVFAVHNGGNLLYNYNGSGSVVSGASLRPCGFYAAQTPSDNTSIGFSNLVLRQSWSAEPALTGTWRTLGSVRIGNSNHVRATMFQRIA
ncbi:phage tail protein [uncultured Ruegeria sp.]|uniref:phage tail-collar fiber domain-containing protein n=1 Tax=uncultured Ruegeria sp. TaxID=259304 RepID=UPI00262EF766|nr:phage tail protein [uncultured Ruegeria sp.]